MDFHSELTDLLNRYSLEKNSDTPDFILATYLEGCLEAFDNTIKQRSSFYGHHQQPKDIKFETEAERVRRTQRSGQTAAVIDWAKRFPFNQEKK